VTEDRHRAGGGKQSDHGDHRTDLSAVQWNRLADCTLRNMIEGVIISQDASDWLQSQIIFANDAAGKIMGRAPDAMLGQRPTQFFAADMTRSQAERLRLELQERQMFRGEMLFRGNGAEPIMTELTISVIREGPSLTHYVCIQRDVTALRRLQHRLLKVSADEQRRLGQALHDGPNQELAGLALEASSLSRSVAARCPEASERLAGLGHALRRVNQKLRLLAEGLVPSQTDERGLAAALEQLVARTRKVAGLSCELDVNGDADIDDEAVVEQLYLIAQEAVLNAVNHARASRIDLRIRRDAEGLEMTVVDDGQGIDPGNAREGLGLTIMPYRGTAIGGEVSVDGRDGGGTVVRCLVPAPRLPGAGGRRRAD
jgi:PAS domain S-box-containing protein